MATATTAKFNVSAGFNPGSRNMASGLVTSTAANNPAAVPASVTRAESESTMRTMCPCRAPMVTRMPISRERRVIE